MEYDEGDEELRSETLSGSSQDDGGPSEAPASRRERLRAVLLPAIQSRVTALGGWVDVQLPADDNDHEYDDGNEAEMRTVRVYKLGDEALGCLKDLKRFWRMDDNDDDRTIGRMFYETGVLNNDLLPILNCANQPDPSIRQMKASLAAADLIAAMTWPINVVEELREAHAQDNGDRKRIDAAMKIDYSSLLAAQRAYKSAILKSGAIKTLFKMLTPRLDKGMRERSERDENVISLILHIWRNLAAIKDKALSGYRSAETIEEANLQSELICQLASDSVFDVLITLASLSNRTDFNQWNMVTLEIFYLLFRGVEKPDALVRRGQDASKVIREEKLGKLLDAEVNRKRMESRRGVTRHSRFGTTVVIEQGKDRFVMHKQASVANATLNPGMLMDQAKKKRAVKIKDSNELAPPAELRPEAIEVLQAVAMSFLESAFNPFFGSVLRDIKMERAKVREVDNVRYLFLVRFFLEYFIALREYEVAQSIDPASEDGHDFDLIAEISEASTIGYVALRMKLCLEEEPQPLWTELHAAVDCFIQILLVMDGLYYSGNEDYKDVSEILQNKLYYEAETLEMVLKVVVCYKDQSIQYLDAIIRLMYVMLRMLEKYSKNQDYVFVKKKASRAKKAKKGQSEALGDASDEDEEMALEGANNSFSEHKLAFGVLERRFASDKVVATLVRYLSLYKDFKDETQVKQIVGLLHRIAIKAQGEGRFFRVTTLELFRRILDDQACLPKTAAYKDLFKFITYILKQFFKLAQTNQLLFIEAFFSHNKTELRKEVMQEPSSDEDNDGPKAMRMPADIKVKKGMSWAEEMGVAVGLLSNMNRDDLLQWVKDMLSAVAKTREAVIEETDKDRISNLEEAGPQEGEDNEGFAVRLLKARMEGPSPEALAALQAHEVPYEDEDKQDVCTRNPHLKLLLRLIKWESRESDERTHLIWTIPASLTPADLLGYVQIVDKYLLEPFMPPDDEQALDDLVRKEYKRKPRRVRSESPPSDGEGKGNASSDDAALFSDPEAAAAIRGTRKKLKKAGKEKTGKGKGKGKHEGGAEDDKATKRRKKRVEEAKKYRTAEFILDSDDDEEADRLFFEREEALRLEMATRAGRPTAAADGSAKKAKKADKQAGKKQKAAAKPKQTKQSKKTGKKSKGKERATSGTEEQDSDEDAWSSPSEADNLAPAMAKHMSPTSSPEPVSRTGVTSEADSDLEEASSSPHLGDSSAPSLKRARSSAAGSEDEQASSPKMSTAAASKKGRVILDSDDE